MAHLTTFLRLALSVSPSLSWFEFFFPLHPLHAIFPFASAIRHQVMVMVIGGGQGGRGGPGYRVAGRHFWTQSDEHGVPRVYLVQSGAWGVLLGSLWFPQSLLGVSSLLGMQGPFSPRGASQEELRGLWPICSLRPQNSCPWAPKPGGYARPSSLLLLLCLGPSWALKTTGPKDLAHPSEEENACQA